MGADTQSGEAGAAQEAERRRIGMPEVLTEIGRVEGRLSERIGHVDGKVADLSRTVAGHIASEDGMAEVVLRLERSVAEMAAVRAGDTAKHDELVGGHRDIIGRLDAGAKRMDAMQIELTENTKVTTETRDNRTTLKTLRRWWVVLGSVIGAAGATAYGLWQGWSVWVGGGK